MPIRRIYQSDKQRIKARMRKRRQSLRRFVAWTKSGKTCEWCGRKPRRLRDLVYHHIDPSDKLIEVTKMPNKQMSKEMILLEISKCVLICSRCHQAFHIQEKREAAGLLPTSTSEVK